MNPHIRFVYSWIYDESYRKSPRIQKAIKEEGREYPSPEEIRKYIEEIEKIWRKVGEKILSEIAAVTTLDWQEKEIKCYVIGFGNCFSDPLTMSMFFNKNDFIDTLAHELIHQIFIQNIERIEKEREYIDKVYVSETITTKNHIMLHAIHKELILELFGKKRLKREIKSSDHAPDYKRSWEIVEAEGHKKLIDKFRSLLNPKP